MEHHFLGFNPHSMYPPPSMHQIFQEQDLFREIDLLDLDFPTSLDNYVGNGEQEDEDGMMLTDLLLSSSSSSNSSTGFGSSGWGSSSSPISMSNDFESFELVSVESEGDPGRGGIGPRETTTIRTDGSKENEETDEDEIVWLDKQNNPVFFSSEDEEDDTDGDDQSKPSCISLISSEESGSGSESETAESEAQQSDDGQEQEGIATEAAGFGCEEVEISHNINEKDSSSGPAPISLSRKRSRSSAPPLFQDLLPPPPPSELLNTSDCSSDDSDNKSKQPRAGRSSSPALSTTSTISIKDEDYDENGIYNQNRFHFDHDTLIQWEHSYAMPVSPPPPPPPPSRAKVNRGRGRGQPQRHTRRQQKAGEEFGERAALKLIPAPVPVPVRRSPRSACQESASKIRKIINDSILSDLSEEDESETEDGQKTGRQSGSQQPQQESCMHEDWKWEIEEYSNYLSLRESEIESNGVFAKYAIPAQVCFIEYKGKRVKTSEVDGLESNYRSEGILHDYMFCIDENVTIDATEYCSENLSKYINHSCSPNAYSVEMVLYGKKRIILMSLREIQPDEEITYDYLFPPESDPNKRLPCNCHAANCRGFIN